MQVLVRLAQQPGQVVSREHLLAAVWADTFVTDDVLKRSISELRRALGDDARQPVYIETIPKGGYRLIAPVVTVAPSDPASAVEHRRLPTEPGRVTVELAHQSVQGYLLSWVVRHSVPAVLTICLVAGILAAAWWAGRSRSTPNDGARRAAPVERSHSRLTFSQGLQTDATWSPDGQFIAYTSDFGGNFDVWVQPVAGGNPFRITTSPAHETQPDWSPDGSRVVFRSERDGGGLFVVPAFGGVEQQVSTFGTHPSWSPDNREILFLDGTAPGDFDDLMRLFAVSAEQGEPREILADFLARGLWSWVEPHPDGRISALGSHRTLGPGFYTVRRDGSEVVSSNQSAVTLRVTGGDGKDRRRFRWHPSGTALYVQTDSNGVYNLWRVRVDRDTLAWLSMDQLTTGAGPDVAPAISRDGTRLAFTTEQESSRLWVFPLDHVARRLGIGKPLTEDRAVAQHAAMSPNGEYVAYNLARPGLNHPEAWVTKIAEGTSEMVPTTGLVSCWSPDGGAIAYKHFQLDREPSAGAVAVRKLGGNERFVSRWSTDFQFYPSDWGDGALVGTYQTPPLTGRTALALWSTTNPSADKPERILIGRTGFDLWEAKFSPNGRWLSFVAHRPDRPANLEMHVAPAAGSSPQRWTRVAADHAWPDKPRWAPDGRTLYFVLAAPVVVLQSLGSRLRPGARETGRPAVRAHCLQLAQHVHFPAPRHGGDGRLVAARRAHDQERERQYLDAHQRGPVMGPVSGSRTPFRRCNHRPHVALTSAGLGQHARIAKYFSPIHVALFAMKTKVTADDEAGMHQVILPVSSAARRLVSETHRSEPLPRCALAVAFGDSPPALACRASR